MSDEDLSGTELSVSSTKLATMNFYVYSCANVHDLSERFVPFRRASFEAIKLRVVFVVGVRVSGLD